MVLENAGCVGERYRYYTFMQINFIVFLCKLVYAVNLIVDNEPKSLVSFHCTILMAY